MNDLVYPILLPLLAAAACLVVRDSMRAQRIMAGVTVHALLAIAAIHLVSAWDGNIRTLALGGWPATFGIVLVQDLLAAIMLTLSALIAIVGFWYTIAGGATPQQESRYLWPVLLLLVAGVNWAFMTSDLFNLFVAFELILLSSYVIVSLDVEKTQLREAYKFAVFNIIASTFFLAAAGLTYGLFGTLNFADLAIKVAEAGTTGPVLALGTLILLVFGIKAALFPVFFWLPNVYPRVCLGLVPYFTGILTKVGVYCLFRVFTLIFPEQMADWFQPLLLIIAGLTMLVGVLAALGQWTIRRILSIHIISQIGYMIFGLAIFTAGAVAAGLFALIHNVIVKTSLFLVAGCVVATKGTDKLKSIHGLMHHYPWLAILFIVAAFSLAGFPPTSGFYGKYVLAVEGFRAGFMLTVTVSLITSVFTATSMIKIWGYAFQGEKPEGPREPMSRGMVAVTAALTGLAVAVGLGAGIIMEASNRVGDQLFDRRAYVEAVINQPLPGEMRELLDWSAARGEEAP